MESGRRIIPNWFSEGDEAQMTAGGGNIICAEIIRNKQSPLCGVAPIEDAERETACDSKAVSPHS